jgi:hypothetical protein
MSSIFRIQQGGFMNALQHAAASAAIAGMCLGLALRAHAGPFDPVSQTRSPQGGTTAIAWSANGDHDGWDIYQPPTWFTDTGAFSGTAGVGQRSIASPDGLATANGQSAISQQSFIGDSVISFSSVASAEGSGSASGGGDYLSSSTLASLIESAFDVATATWVTLTMDSRLDPGATFSFQLARDGTTVWDDEVLHDAGGAEIRSFSQSLLLTPGHYTLNSSLSLNGSVASGPDHLPASAEFHAQGSAEFRLAAIPEPQTWLLMLGGLGLVGSLVRKSRTAGPA